MKQSVKNDIYNQVTLKIIADLERGELTWLKPWKAGREDGGIIRPLRHNGLAYRGINVLILWNPRSRRAILLATG
jgi:antirestriction protein ArdC